MFAGLEAFFVPKNGPENKSEGGQKSSRGSQNISRGGSCPSLPAPMLYLKKNWKIAAALGLRPQIPLGLRRIGTPPSDPQVNTLVTCLVIFTRR